LRGFLFSVGPQPSFLAYFERFYFHLIYWSLERVGEKEGALQIGVSSVWRGKSSLFS